jgi:hypothetical protein
MGAYSVLVSGIGASGSLLLAPVWTLTAIATVLLLGAIWPDLFRIALGALSRAVWRVLRRPDAVIDWWPPGTPRTGPAVDRMDRRAAWLADLLYAYRADVRAIPPARQGVRGGRVSPERDLPPGAGPDAVSLRALPRRGERHAPADRGGPGRAHLPGLLRADARGRRHRRRGVALDHGGHRAARPRPPLHPAVAVSTTYLAATAGFLCLGLALARDASRAARRQPGPR